VSIGLGRYCFRRAEFNVEGAECGSIKPFLCLPNPYPSLATPSSFGLMTGVLICVSTIKFIFIYNLHR